jgi:hypothetical protein
MVTVTADDIRVLAQDNSVQPVLALVAGRIEVMSAAEVGSGQVLYTKAQLAEEYGVDLTDVEAQLAAAHVTSAIAPT